MRVTTLWLSRSNVQHTQQLGFLFTQFAPLAFLFFVATILAPAICFLRTTDAEAP